MDRAGFTSQTERDLSDRNALLGLDHETIRALEAFAAAYGTSPHLAAAARKLIADIDLSDTGGPGTNPSRPELSRRFKPKHTAARPRPTR